MFSVGQKRYVFLSGSQQILEISTSIMDTYFKICTGQKEHSALNETDIRQMTEALQKFCTVSVPHDEAQKTDMLIVNVTRECNMACKYCFAATRQEGERRMPLSVFRKAIVNMAEVNPDNECYTVYFFGGEPLLHKQFVKDAVRVAKEELTVGRSKSVRFLLNTNGTLIDDATLRFFAAERFAVTVSIDGPQEVNDTNRVFRNGQGSFRLIVQNIKRLKESGINFNLRATISPQTSNLLDTFSFFERLEIPYSYAFTIDSTEKERSVTRFDDRAIDLLGEQLENTMDFFCTKLMRGERVYCSDFLRKIHRLRNKSIRLQGCEAGRSSIAVDETGCYYPCQNMLPLRETSVGNVHSGIDADRLKLYCSKKLSDLAECRHCWAN